MNFSFKVGEENESTDTIYNNHKMKQIQAVSLRKRKKHVLENLRRVLFKSLFLTVNDSTT